MPYRTHPSDRHGLTLKLADLIRKIPDEEFDGFVADARKLQYRAEFGQPNLVRNCHTDNPYWFEHHLIKKADTLLAEGKPLKAFMVCMEENNHGHSGFTDQVLRVYCRPTNNMEREVSESIRVMALRIAQGLIDSNPPTLEVGRISDGWMSMIGIEKCICYLGADVPSELIERFTQMLNEYKARDPENPEVDSLKNQFEYRFK